ncbi:MAG: hypothetical protein A2836_02175 [Candidatus Taylorbacteria bacterium RIFCSPHIGHO2_01_FULL_45_63]|uniref:Uncharacterized protein n=1 Tax=Candidatus Taylorbacteria bacterium RIFCSPHIGHO2_02_FULL_45_35 TaxID=1802311 RepID=A0A1G2MUJ9_9BACT|nr:MAG: hypothetical protein A2836_02175 [Candidatus Taylorbacteria bacterium RIFCSPHIGHO2_01_FULL_45_63]OHA27414.1 MAG: hypothetical protein A3D56_03940 [Candidatus Taylorbacteria bacterium RIFCSPHIGHO2_02_FULL_45_35]OHA34277.1 MAG: hypothetical protein A3A22_01330 [Candidatus Taylorbacteria bacterium RIFCSPLOWO2_01_FULL_45_34b]
MNKPIIPPIIIHIEPVPVALNLNRNDDDTRRVIRGTLGPLPPWVWWLAAFIIGTHALLSILSQFS